MTSYSILYKHLSNSTKLEDPRDFQAYLLKSIKFNEVGGYRWLHAELEDTHDFLVFFLYKYLANLRS